MRAHNGQAVDQHPPAKRVSPRGIPKTAFIVPIVLKREHGDQFVKVLRERCEIQKDVIAGCTPKEQLAEISTTFNHHRRRVTGFILSLA